MFRTTNLSLEVGNHGCFRSILLTLLTFSVGYSTEACFPSNLQVVQPSAAACHQFKSLTLRDLVAADKSCCLMSQPAKAAINTKPWAKTPSCPCGYFCTHNTDRLSHSHEKIEPHALSQVCKRNCSNRLKSLENWCNVCVTVTSAAGECWSSWKYPVVNGTKKRSLNILGRLSSTEKQISLCVLNAGKCYRRQTLTRSPCEAKKEPWRDDQPRLKSAPLIHLKHSRFC